MTRLLPPDRWESVFLSKGACATVLPNQTPSPKGVSIRTLSVRRYGRERARQGPPPHPVVREGGWEREARRDVVDVSVDVASPTHTRAASAETGGAMANALAARCAMGGTGIRMAPAGTRTRRGTGVCAPQASLAALVRQVEAPFMKEDVLKLQVGQQVRVGVTVKEGKRTRVQPYEGTVIAMHNAGIGTTVTVRKVLQGVGVERVFPLHSPLVTFEGVKGAGEPKVRRAKLYYLRDRQGKAARIKTKFSKKE